MAKRELTPELPTDAAEKRTRVSQTFAPIKVATAQAAAAADLHKPYFRVLSAQKETGKEANPGESVVYWMRMADLRSEHSHFE
jgi:deoxyribodipyrimidine photo-lyase